MIRPLLSLVLLALGASASAQTTPTTRRPASKAAAARKPAKTSPRAAAAPDEASGKGQNVYAAPGMPVNVDNPKKVGSYDGNANRQKSGTTLAPK